MKHNPGTGILPYDFYQRDALEVAPELLGKLLIRRFDTRNEIRLPITEVEVYRGSRDLACHASKGMTPRNRVMFEEGGHIYMYLVYGIHWMLNIVTAPRGVPHALLIRGVGEVSGPGRVTRLLQLDRSFYGISVFDSELVRIENAPQVSDYQTLPRVGIDYAGEPWISKPWRFIISPKKTGH
ncbi:MAG: DNA-3-methyladenine glycosylase [Bacteroidales bacterium]|nr:DNA-3-methyladenine glycosylase [Bacteroidales bacterium]